MSLLLYGATGYTGDLIARTAACYGIRPILAGRNRQTVSAQARKYDLEFRAFSLDDVDLSGITAVLHCAGPFTHTALPMATACINAGVHYIDITGEIDVFESLHALDERAKQAGVQLLPGSGFDVVPSDCMALHLKQRMPDATHLMLGIAGTGPLSRGTATTVVTHSDKGGCIRRDGKLVRVPPAWRTRMIDFGGGAKEAVTIPWGDVSTSYYSTGIPNVEVYSVMPPKLKSALKLSRYLGPLLKLNWLKRKQIERIRAGDAGPSEQELRDGHSYVWGRVENDAKASLEAVCVGPNGYALTAHTALLIAKRVLSGNFKAGFMTPALAYGADLILEVPGVMRTLPQ